MRPGFSGIRRVLFALLALAALSGVAQAGDGVRDLPIRAKPPLFGVLGPGSASTGDLLDRGALSLRSADKNFGGLSGLIVSEDGARFLAITDSSHWVMGELRYERGLLVDVVGAKIAPLLDLDGRPLKGKRGDAEGIAGSMHGDVYVSFEGDHRIWRYDFAGAGLEAVPVNVETPADLRNAPRNKGLEAITLLADGRLLAITEHEQNADGTTKAWLIDPRKPDAFAPLSFVNMEPFEVTDVRQLPDGSILTLERRFDRTKGIGFACRRIALQALSNAAPVNGPVIANGGMRNVVANMEGLAVREGEDGETFVYMLSDNNFGTLVQRTLLIMYRLKPASRPAAEAASPVVSAAAP